MTSRSKVGLYGLVLVAMVAGGAAVGAAVGPIDVGTTTAQEAQASPVATGLLVSEGGFTLVPEDRLADAGPFAFTITGPDGTAVTRFDTRHDRELHLIVASRDLHQYAHVHPARDARGVWTVDLPALPGGSYRAFADFQPTGAEHHVLGIDLAVPGSTVGPPLQPRAADLVDGFDVTLDRPPGAVDRVTVTVRRDGGVVTTQPYLGAAGHLVALRDGDLAYLHVHPIDEAPSGPVRFAVDVPSAGRYALFFDFQVDDRVHIARFVIDAAPAAAATTTSGSGHGGH
jgi:hypothetical protein